ncbi:MAG TPA: site-specific DNA-methyltransferase [Thermoplasmata archaeon]|nr:site-specific DNA-methyltransferase [Thermoplasmata archaeon]
MSRVSLPATDVAAREEAPGTGVTGAIDGRDSVIEGDALAVLRSLPEGSVHLAITSPPYNVGIAYAGYADDRRHEEYLGWLREVWKALHRVLVEGGRFALNVAPTSIKDFRPIHHDLSTDLRGLGYIMRTEIIWYKQTMGRRTAWGSWRSPSNPHIVPSWEYVLVFSKGRWKLDGRREDIDILAKEFERFSDGFWAIPPERHRRGHPAPFPEELIERLVKYYSYRGNTVLDMFGGTGTVGAVARRTGRHFITIDISPVYCDDAMQRISRATPPGGAYPIAAPRRLRWTASAAPTAPDLRVP